jgi:LPXTG-motif cell wall-anchored protein
MRYQYVVILKKDGERATDVLSVLLCIFSVICFIYSAYGALSREAKTGGASWLLFLTAGVLLAGLITFALRRRQQQQVRYRYLLLVAAIGWMAMTSVPWVAGFFFLLAFLEYQTKRPLEIGFDQDRVVINSLLRQRYDWTVFNNIVLKDGLLTLDFKNNRLMQKEVADDEEEDDADEEEFNAYCRERLAASAGSPEMGG